MKNKIYKVQVVERERGWSSTVLCTKEFKTLNGAQNFADKINAKNTSSSAPDYYIQAEIIN